MNNTENTFALIKSEFDNEIPHFDADCDIKSIFSDAKRHDIAPLVADAAVRCGVVSEEDPVYNKLKKELSLAAYREAQTSCALDVIRDALNTAKVRFIPMKGAVIRPLYPQPWMRTSCDIDVLVREDDIKAATDALIQSGFTTDNVKDFHDIDLYYGQTHLELHFSICEGMERIDRLLSKVWDDPEPADEYEYREKPEFFAFHHIAHMAYHFLEGGCGIRPFIDLYVMKEKGFYDENKLLPLLEEAELVKFYGSVCRLTDVWMNKEKHDGVTEQMQEYVIKGGAFGTTANADLVKTTKEKGKAGYFLSLVFPPYSEMRAMYPKLEKHKILLPLYYIKRGFVKLFGKDRAAVHKKINETLGASDDEIASVNDLLLSVGLKE